MVRFAGAHARNCLRLVFLGLVLLAAGAPAVAMGSHGEEHGVLRATLPNGLRVVLVRNTLAPVVATSVNYLVGSDEAPAGFPGTAHAQEHMMFRGSPGLTADQLANIGSVMGGSFNANTRESLTQYLYTVPSDDLDVALHVEALRMQDVTNSEKDWDKERGAIEQEVAQDLSNPGYVVYKRLREAMFGGTPYEHDALGTRPSFEKTTAAMLKQFHDDWYAPNNAILVVVGDLEPKATLAKIKELFGGIKSKTLPARPDMNLAPVEPQQINVDTDRSAANLLIAFRMAGLDSADFPALEVLSDVLGSQRFDLYGLVPRGKALAAGFSLDPLPHSGLGYASVSFPSDRDPKALEAEMRSIIAKVIKDGVPPDLVAAAKRQERRAAEFQKNSIEGLASVWADAIALYGLKSPDDDLKRIEKVTVDDVNRVAKKYLNLDQTVTALMMPKSSGKPVASSGFGGQENISLGEANNAELPDWAKTAIGRLQVPSQTAKPIVSTLANGITLIVQPTSVSDTITVMGHIKNRPQIQEPPGKSGVSSVLEELFSYGTEHLDRLAFQRALDDIGANEGAGADFSIEVLSEYFDRGVGLLADNELHPALPENEMKLIRDQYAQVVAVRNKSPGFLRSRSLRENLFPKADPSLNDATPQSLKSLSINDVRGYYKSAFRPDLTTIVVIGNVDPDNAKAVIEKHFGGWTATGPTPNTDLPTAPNNRPAKVAVPDASRVQDLVIVGQTLGLTRTDPDYYAIQLGDAVLGGGFYSTRLSNDLRKNAGLVYSVSSDLQAGKTRSVYVVQYACDPENVSKASNIIAKEIETMRNAPATDDEISRVKSLLIRQIPLGESSIDDIASGYIARHDLGLPLDEPQIAAQRYIDLTSADVQAAFKKWMRPKDLVRISQGPAPK
ncbi:MAG: pitrilysin family protein [Alphaproteobacteria bacterium]